MKPNILLCILGCSLLVGGCFDLAPYKKDVVVNCILTDNPVQTLQLSIGNNTTKLTAQDLQKATISLFDETDDKNVGSFHYEGEDNWILDYAAVPTHLYKLEIKIPDRQVISAHTTMPGVIVPEYKDGFSLYKTENLPDDAMWLLGMDYDPESEKYSFVERIATNIVTIDDFNSTGELYHHKDFFPAQSVVLYPLVEDRPLHKKYIRIPSLEEGGMRIVDKKQMAIDNYISVSGSFADQHPYGFPQPSYVLLMAVSPEYDQFLKASIVGKDYTNIENGIGIFGAKTEQKQYWTNFIVLG
jgi:hypothetical protein